LKTANVAIDSTVVDTVIDTPLTQWMIANTTNHMAVDINSINAVKDIFPTS
jgi:hypothetical protein